MKFSFFKAVMTLMLIVVPSHFLFGQEITTSNNLDCNIYQYQDRYKNGIPEYVGSEELGGLQLYLERFTTECTNSKYLESAEKLLSIAREKRAESSLSIAIYYLKQYEEHHRGLKGAISRLKEITLKYPQFSKTDEVLFLLVKSYLYEKGADQAEKYYRRILDEFSFSPYVCEANKLFPQSKR
jgi:hypothetical protein